MNHEELQYVLDELERDPKAAMDRVPPKRGEGAARAPCPFSAKAIEDGTYVEQRDRIRGLLYTPPAGEESLDEAAIKRNDRPENLVDELRYVRPADMDAAGLSRAALAESPWSDDYWAIYLGILGKRYDDPNFPGSEDWKVNFDYIKANPAASVVASGGAAAIDRLSPSEKYDLLVGDARGTLTAAMWAEGQGYYDSYGKVEPWMGICHGWAPVAYMLPRPRKAVTALAADGRTRIRFYPSDMKALASLLWANAGTETRFIGGRCAETKPKTDAMGRALVASAFDTNPGTWHMCAVNQIGAGKRSFVMDATYDYEVWNQPVYAYQCWYFNPEALKIVPTLREATVARGDFKRDRFRKYRTSSYASIAGVVMRVKYVVETRPSHAPEDAPSRDGIESVDYYYDLELNESGTILGGEWYQNRHPDFLWTPPRGARAVSSWDASATGAWRADAVMPASWRSAAIGAAGSAQPLAKIVEGLIQLANG
jgi:hypothetical protein